MVGMYTVTRGAVAHDILTNKGIIILCVCCMQVQLTQNMSYLVNMLVLDATLDLNSLVLQLSSVEHMWEPYGEAIGVPHDILTQIKTMEVGKRDKFVEVLDYWLYMHPKNNTPTWKEVCKGLQLIGCNELVTEIMKVYTTGKYF